MLQSLFNLGYLCLVDKGAFGTDFNGRGCGAKEEEAEARDSLVGRLLGLNRNASFLYVKSQYLF